MKLTGEIVADMGGGGGGITAIAQMKAGNATVGGGVSGGRLCGSVYAPQSLVAVMPMTGRLMLVARLFTSNESLSIVLGLFFVPCVVCYICYTASA